MTKVVPFSIQLHRTEFCIELETVVCNLFSEGLSGPLATES